MATDKQAAANRRNAASSTGPRSQAGKARSAQNALKYGIHAQNEIISGETAAARLALENRYFERWNPTTPEQVMQVRILIRCDWEDTRYAFAAAHLWEHAIDKVWQPQEATVLGNAFANFDRTFTRLERRREILARTYQKALHELERLSPPDPQPPAPSPEPPPVDTPPPPPV